MKQIWKYIPGTENKYEVSNFGNVRSYRFDKVKNLKLHINNRGYATVGICGKVKNVHRLVLKVFKPIPNMENLVVNHIDGNKTNNNILNLEWCTQKYNIFHSQVNGKHYQFSDEDRLISSENRLKALRKKVLCIETNEIFESISAAAKAKNTFVQNICRCCNKKLNTTGGFHWKYA